MECAQVYSTDHQDYDTSRGSIEQMRNEAVETTSLKRLTSGIAEGCATLDVCYDCWRIRILDKPRGVVLLGEMQ